MQRSTLLFLLLACAIAATILVVAVRSDAAPPIDVGGGNGGAAPERPTVAPPPVDVPGGAPHVVVTVTSRERFAPPPVEVSRAQSDRGEPLPTRLVAGIGAGFDAAPARRGVAIARVSFGEGEFLRQVVVEPERVLPVTVGGIVTMRGRVTAADGAPIAGAAVWFGELLPDGGRSEAWTDADGNYECGARVGEGVPFVVRAPGHASIYRTLTVSTASMPADAALSPACTLRVQLATAATDGAAPRVFVAPAAPLSTGLAQWPFFLQALDGGYEVDARGGCTIDDLPADGVATIYVRHPFAEVASADARLAPGDRQQLVQVPLAARRRAGMVVDEQGAALAGVLVCAHAERDGIGGTPSQRLLPPHVAARRCVFAQTDAAGAFAVGVPDGGGPLLSLRRHGHAGRDVPWDQAAEDAFVLPAWRGGDARLRVLPPKSAVAWSVETNLGDGVRAGVAADQPWVVALPHAGVFDVHVAVVVDDAVREEREWRARMVTDVVDVETPAVD